MAEYNPDAPLIVGQEWVPIKDNPYTASTDQEAGHSFILPTTTTMASGRVYVQSIPPEASSEAANFVQTSMIEVYPQGLENDTGPLKQVIVPVDGGQNLTPLTVDVDTTIAGDLALPDDGNEITCDPSFSGAFSDNQFTMNFDFNSFPELSGKRIINVELLINIRCQDPELFAKTSVMFIEITDENLFSQSQSVADSVTNDLIGLTTDRTTLTLTAGELNEMFPVLDDHAYPWLYTDLQRFDNSTAIANRFCVRITISRGPVPDLSSFVNFDYAAMRVTYCEEQRVAYGARIGPHKFGVNGILLRNSSGTYQPSIAAGNYSVVTTNPIGPDNFTYRSNTYNGLLELYDMRDQPAVLINKTTKIGQTFQDTESLIMPQLSLHTASAAITGVHGYGVQIGAPVYSGNSARQEIVSRGGGPSTSYPWARFYARRFGDTTAPLVLSHFTLPSITKSITVAEFDALPEITDGWKQVDLRFDSPTPSFNGLLGLETYEWTSTTSAGTQWQVLAADAPAISGIAPAAAQITGPHNLDETTYGGSSANLRWNAAEDTSADAVLMFAQDMPVVSGLTFTLATQPVSGIGFGPDCGVLNSCIPTGVTYNQITWSPFSTGLIPVTGFGYYELQRSDVFDTDWSTILKASSQFITGFSDYEARIGVESCYRIRAVHPLEFLGPWSSQVCGTIPAPGVVVGGDGNSSLVFTSNELGAAGTLAYTMVWESSPDETFTFPEGDQKQLQLMFGKDFPTAFWPLERGGEQFDRTLLVQAAAVPTGLMRDGFRSLRDLAWEQASYIAVRNELGDRWYATIMVPSGSVKRNRRLYLAQIRIVEVTDTPSIVEVE